MEQENKSLESKKKLKWYWWVLIAFVGLSVLCSLFPNDEKLANDEKIKSQPASDTVRQVSKAEIDLLLKSLSVSKDEFDKTAFYSCQSTTKYDNTNSIHLYLGREGNYVWPRLRIQYSGNSWIFMNMIRLSVDGQTRAILPEDKIKRDNDGNGVWEVIDKKPNSTDLLLLEELANSKSAKIRCEGPDKVNDRVVSEKEKKNIKTILDILTKINGQKL